MRTDSAIQEAFKALKAVKFTEYEINPRYQWYYAEDCHYVVNDTKTNAIWLIKARSPLSAFDAVQNKLTD